MFADFFKAVSDATQKQFQVAEKQFEKQTQAQLQAATQQLIAQGLKQAETSLSSMLFSSPATASDTSTIAEY